MAKIFVSYRRGDNAAGFARSLAQDLRSQFGDSQVFRDIRSIPPGYDFREVIREKLENCVVMLVVIGQRWLIETDSQGRRRLDDPDDWVRQEVRAALERHIRVIPVLVADAKIPKESDLPEDLEPLASRHAIELTDRNWERDVEQLMELLREIPALLSWSQRLGRRLGPDRRDQRSRRPTLLNPFTWSLKARVGIALSIAVFFAAIGAVVNEIDSGLDAMTGVPQEMSSSWSQPALGYPPEAASVTPAGAASDWTGSVATPAMPGSAIDLTGAWLDPMNKFRYRLEQDGEDVEGDVYDLMGNPVGYVSGVVKGRRIILDWEVDPEVVGADPAMLATMGIPAAEISHLSQMLRGTADLVAAPDNTQLSGVTRNQLGDSAQILMLRQ